jgi:hypothetical protein
MHVLQLGSGRSFLFPGGFDRSFRLLSGIGRSFLPSPIPRELVAQSSFLGDKHHRGSKKKAQNLKARGPAFFSHFASPWELVVRFSSSSLQEFGRPFLSARL